jgi:L-ascorbate metabolism protein UlaG (beta-lactamase superfamily)
MKLTFLNHSCFIVEHNHVKILCDPWLEGSVFVRGWKHLAPSPINYEDFKDIQYIWFSHEHPDHFFPPNLNKIPVEIRKNITVLFHYTIDKRVVNYCTKAGYKEVVELQTNEYYSLAEDFKIMNDPYTEGDSWIVFKTKDQTILNTNDCGMRNLPEITAIKDKIGKVDVLLTQFSYAYWAGNRDEKPYRERIAREKLEWLKFQCDVFKPAVTIPIASYVYFCHSYYPEVPDKDIIAVTTDYGINFPSVVWKGNIYG